MEIYSYVGVLSIELVTYGLKNVALKAARIHQLRDIALVASSSHSDYLLLLRKCRQVFPHPGSK